MEALFTAANVSGIAANVSTILVALVGVSLLFMGCRYIRKAGVK